MLAERPQRALSSFFGNTFSQDIHAGTGGRTVIMVSQRHSKGAA